MTESNDRRRETIRTHLRFGWSLLFAFLLLGIALEAMHGFKIGWYLSAAEETRRLMLTLAHAHGVLFGLVNVAFAASLHAHDAVDATALALPSALLRTASLLMPTGFLLGGLITYGGDPGFGIFLVAPGALLMALAVAGVLRAMLRDR